MKEQYKNRLIELTQTLVDIPTINMPPHGNEKPGQDCVARHLKMLRMDVLEYSPESVPDFAENPAFIAGQNYAGRKNVMGVWRGSGGGRSVILNGHMDVVTEYPLTWKKCQPFHSVVDGDRLYGRGTADMKGGLACALTAIEMLRDEGFTPKGDVIFESVVDEEYASSAGSIAARMLGYNADFAILLEPTGHSICPACVGSIVTKITVQGVAGMPYTGEVVVNPVYMLGEVIGCIRQYEAERLQKVSTPELWKDTPQAVQLVITKAKSGDVRPHGQLSTPEDAWIELVIQTYPGEDMDVVYQEFVEFMQAHFSQPEKMNVELEYHYCRAAQSKDSPAIELLARVAAQYTPNAKVCGAMFSCDQFAFTDYGNMPAAVFGPVGERLHGPDEWVSISSMEKVTLSIREFIKEWCG